MPPRVILNSTSAGKVIYTVIRTKKAMKNKFTPPFKYFSASGFS